MNTSSIGIERALDKCISAILEQGRSIEECLEAYPDQRRELEPPLKLMVRLRAARAIQPPPAFRQETAARLKEKIAAHPRYSKPKGLWQRLRDWLEALHARTSHFFQKRRYALNLSTTTLLLIVLVTVGAGLIRLSAQAMAGDVLYPLKITTEETRLTLSRDRLKNADLRLRFADRRIEEAIVLLRDGEYAHLDEPLSVYVTHLESLKTLLEDESTLTPDEQLRLAQWLVTHLNKHQTQLEVLQAYGLLPPTQAIVETALAAQREILKGARVIITTHPPGKPLVPPIPTLTLIPSPTFFMPTPEEYPTLPSITLPTLIPPIITALPEPTRSPLPWPTDVPTAWPTDAPTAWPTDAPTAWPTDAPTAWPTDAPTAWPTDAPTAWPTPDPSTWPTEVPTLPPPPTPPPELGDPPPPPSWP